MFGASNNTFGGFGNTNQQTQQQPQQPQVGGGLFGAQPSSSFNAFGQQPVATGFNQPQSTGFDAFGAPAPATTGFGTANPSTNVFAQPQNTTTSLFGAPQAQAAATTGFGGFGNAASPANNTFGGFGGSPNAAASTTGLFGQKPAATGTFGASNTGFGSNVFGQNAPAAAPFGAAATPVPANGTANPPYAPVTLAENESTPSQKSIFNSIVAMDAYKNASFEELRFQDYSQGRKTAISAGSMGGFGAPQATPAATFGAFNNTATQSSQFGQQPQSNVFGANASANNTFGAQPSGAGGLFGSATSNPSPFGQPSTSTNPSPFGGTTSQTSNTFGNNNLFNNSSNPSPFGAQPAKPSIFGGGTTSNVFGAPTPTAPTGNNIFGTAAAQPQTNVFGAANNQNNPTGGLFGNNNTQSSGGLFGSNNNQNNAQKPGGLFGANTGATSSLFGQPTQASTTTATGFGFGQNNQPQQPTGGLFGNNNQQQSSTSGGLFGAGNNNQQTQQGTSGLFGNNNNNNNTGSPFGNSVGGLFGNNNTATGGLFGAKPANSTNSLFANKDASGQNNPNGFANSAGGGLFGSTQNNNNSFGNAGNNLFGASNNTQLYNNASNNGLFQSQQNQQPTLQARIDQDAYGNNPIFANHGIAPISKTAMPVKKQLPVIDFKPLPRPNTKITKLRGFARSTSPTKSVGAGSPMAASTGSNNSVISRSSAYPKSAEEPLLSPKAFIVRPSPKKFTVDPSTLSNLFRNRSSTIDGASSTVNSTPPPITRNQNRNSVVPRFDPDAEVSAQEAFSKLQNASHRSAQLPVESRASSTAPVATKSPLNSANSTHTLNIPRRVQETDEDAVKHGIMEDDVIVSKKETANTGEYWTCPSLDELCMMSRKDLKAVPNFIAGRKGYGQVQFQEEVDFTGIPNLREDLCGEVIVFKQSLCSVYPDDPVDKPPVGQGLNVPAVITLENCSALDKATRAPITDSNHPRVKQFIKRLMKSEDTQFIDYDAKSGKWTFGVEHFTTYGIDESEDDSINSACDTEGEGDFSSDASDATGSYVSNKQRQETDRSQTADQDAASSDADQEEGPPQAMLFDDDEDTQEYCEQYIDTSIRLDQMLDDDSTASVTGSDETDHRAKQAAKKRPRENTDPENDDALTLLVKPNPTWRSQMGLESHKVAVMQASFFAQPNARRPPIKAPTPVSNRQGLNTAPSTRPKEGQTTEGKRLVNIRQESPPSLIALQKPVHPRVNNQPKIRHPKLITLSQSQVYQKDSSLVDTYLAIGRSFRLSWIGQSDLIVHLKSGQVGNTSKSDDTVHPAMSQLSIQAIQANTFDTAKEIKAAERLLRVQLKHTKIRTKEGIPIISTDSKLRFHHFHASYDKTDRTSDSNAWSLCSALFDELDLGLPPGASAEVVKRITEIRREDSFSDWLESAVAPTVEQEARSLGRVGQSGEFSGIFKLLTGNQIERACNAAIEMGNYRLATLIAQCGRSDPTFRADVLQQTLTWRELRVDAYIDRDLRKIYELIAGNVTVSKGFGKKGLQVDYSEDVSITEQLDWKRTFGLHFWFGASHENLWHAVRTYEDAFEHEKCACSPMPWYNEESSNLGTEAINKWKMNMSQPAYDAIFHIIKMFVDPTYPLEKVLEPQGFGPSPYDYRMPWHLYNLISRVLRMRDFEDRDIIIGDIDQDEAVMESSSCTADMITGQYADQLTRLGLWKWAVFVLMHLEQSNHRKHAIQTYLGRNIQCFDQETEEFVIQTLNIPSTWIYNARADLAHYHGAFYSEYDWLIKAQKHNEAHRILVLELAPELIVRGDMRLLSKLLKDLSGDRVAEWLTGGKIFLDYIEVMERVPRLVKAGTVVDLEDEMIQSLEVVLPGLLREIPSMYRDKLNSGPMTMKQRVCVSEMLTTLTQTASLVSSAMNRLQKMDECLDLGDFQESDRLLWTQRCAGNGFAKALRQAGVEAL